MPDQPDPHAPNQSSLSNAFRMLRYMAKEGRRRARLKAAKRNGCAKLPRFACKICGKTWDFAMIDVKSEIQLDVCADCSLKLSQGYTAFVAPNGFAFIKHPSIENLAGKIEPMTDENMEKVKARMKDLTGENGGNRE